MKLSDKEEELMQILWTHEKAFLKDLRLAFPKPRPAPTTLATLVKRLTTKGYIGYDEVNSNRRYYPLVKRKDYYAAFIRNLVQRVFNNNTSSFASFFTKELELSNEELEELVKIIKQQIKE